MSKGTSYIAVTNNTGQNATIILKWQYSDGSEYAGTSQPMYTNSSATSAYTTVSYNYGFLRTGGSYWQIQVTLDDGSVYHNNWGGPTDKPWYRCDLKEEDNGNNLTFTVTTEEFVMAMYGSCRQNMIPGPFAD